jgi:glycosyltransferase involved in cell wall biosynthesis
MVDLANGLAARGLPVGLLLFKRDGAYFDELRPDVSVEALGIQNRISRPLGVFGYLSYLRRNRPRTVVVSSHSAFLVALIARALIRHTLIVVVHNSVSRERRRSRVIAKHLYRRADEIVAVSDGVAADLETYAHIPRARIRRIYNPVDVKRIAALCREPVSHPWLGDPSLRVVVAAGRMYPQKNYPHLFRTIAHARRSHPEIRLLVLGDGPLRPELERLAKDLGIDDVVDLLGFNRNPFAYMARASRVVLASDYEGFGMVLVEALACGGRVVSTDCPSGPAEILGAGKWGRLVPVRDIEALASAIVAEDPPTTSKAELVSRALDFNIDKTVGAYYNLICGAAS